ncbi:MAG: glutamate--tRNA ligase [Patescibacteria group bacterium]
MTIRTRFAPSPTGYLHVGGIRTALFAWLVARQNNGQFILRLEDTDQAREVEGSAEHLMESLKALGLDYDEGPDIGGPHGPYRQSERLESYKQWAQKLIDGGRAYADPYSAAEVQGFRDEAQANKQPFLYRNHRPDNTPAWDGTNPLRFKSDPKDYVWQDAVMGELKTGPEVIDDFILVKSDGFPTYNFAYIVDDAEMQITHVIRGQEFLASMPNYLNLYEALNLDKPVLATMPHILGPSGNKKLSKRDGAKDVLDYIRDGFLPDALVNFIASMGWNDGTEQEIYSIQQLLDKFSLDRVQKSGARFDEQRLLWMNGTHIRAKTVDELYGLVSGEQRAVSNEQSFWSQEAADYPEDYKKRVLGLVQERLKYFAEIPELTIFFFKDLPVNSELISSHKQLKKLELTEVKNLLEQAQKVLEQSDFSLQDLTDRLNQLLEKTAQKPAILFSLVRIATTQAPASPALAETLALLGKDVSLRRLQQQLDALS